MIVAGEMRSDGPWTLTFGCYGVDLDSGLLRWTNHGSGKRRGLLRMLDFVPFLTNELRDHAVGVVDGCVVTEQGRLLDVVTGEEMQRPPASARAWLDRRRTQPDVLSDPTEDRARAAGRELYTSGQVQMLDGARLFARHGLVSESSFAPPPWTTRDGLELACVEPGGGVRWRWAGGDRVQTNYYGWRYLPGLLLVLQSDAPVETDGRWTLLAIDPATGRVEQELPIEGPPGPQARIEDVAGDGVVITRGGMAVTLLRWHDDALPR